MLSSCDAPDLMSTGRIYESECEARAEERDREEEEEEEKKKKKKRKQKWIINRANTTIEF